MPEVQLEWVPDHPLAILNPLLIDNIWMKTALEGEVLNKFKQGFQDRTQIITNSYCRPITTLFTPSKNSLMKPRPKINVK